MDINTENILNKIDTLKQIYSNLYWTFNPKAKQILSLMDKDLFESFGHNPLTFFKEIPLKKLVEKLEDNKITGLIESLHKEFENYLKEKNTWLNLNYPEHRGKLIVYFSAEYGFHSSLPIYSGGLGVLAGDHCCGASDLGLNFVGIGLLYKQGYVDQKIDRQGKQISHFPFHDYNNYPIKIIKDKEGEVLFLEIDFPKRKVYFQVWELKVGRINLYLLDTDIDQNAEEDREITFQLYGGNRERRISQEILLGIGGIKTLRALHLSPSVYHINEGHSAFIILELAKEIIEKEKLSFKEALLKVKEKVIFTTHTPVKAGNESFSINLIKKYFISYSPDISVPRLLEQGIQGPLKKDKEFSMTILALRYSGFRNAVSQLHQTVSRKMWKNLWPQKSLKVIPIDYITNGINTKKWISPEMHALFTKYIDNEWFNQCDNIELWKKVYTLSEEELWNAHIQTKQRLVDYTKKKIITLYARNHVNKKIIEKIVNQISHENLIIGFGRRFTPYKRATLIFNDEKRLIRLFNNISKPFHVIFTGKAHPADIPGQEMIKKIYNYSLKEPFLGKIIFLENYNMDTAEYMVQGSDVWLNTPRRPLEASGTSGQKAGANGVLNCSVLDGWWAEGCNGKNGWVIGKSKDYTNLKVQDREDSESLYQLLEKRIIPMYYNKQKEWIEMMKESIVSILPQYSIHRMVKEYFTKFYYPIMQREERNISHEFSRMDTN